MSRASGRKLSKFRKTLDKELGSLWTSRHGERKWQEKRKTGKAKHAKGNNSLFYSF